jgi:adenine-specific DNA-methyltransferase
MRLERVRTVSEFDASLEYALYEGDCFDLLPLIPEDSVQLIITSPPYNLGKAYEVRCDLDVYVAHQAEAITKCVRVLDRTGSLCWQVGNYVEGSRIIPLDILLFSCFKSHNLQLRNRIVWHFGHGLHASKRCSGRYEVVLWFTKADDYTFNLDAVRVPQKYPSKRHFKGAKRGQLSSNPLGKNPSDVWEIPNVKGNHIEKTIHPCQFPVGLIEPLVLSLTNPGDLVFDPFAGMASAGVAAALHGRRFWGCDMFREYLDVGIGRIHDALAGKARYRPFQKPVYDHTRSRLSRKPEGFK